MPKKKFAPLTPDRPEIAPFERKVRALFRGVLTRWRKVTTAALRAQKVGKADEDDGLNDEIDAIIAGLDLDLTTGETETLEEALQEAAQDSGVRTFAQVGVGLGDAALTGPAPTAGEIGDSIFDKINTRAVAWAQEHAGDLVSQVSDTTRAAVRSAVADGMAGGERFGDIISRVSNLGVFDPDRAALLAETEIATANGMGALEGFRQARDIGVAVKKSWLIAGGLERICVVCRANAAEGPIDLDDDFSSGDAAPPAHPRCRCVCLPVVDDDSDKLLTNSRPIMMNHGYETVEDRQFHSTFERTFGRYLSRKSLEERDFETAMERLKAPGPLEKISRRTRRGDFMKAIRADQRNIRRAADAMGALLDKIKADIANLEAQDEREAVARQSKDSANN